MHLYINWGTQWVYIHKLRQPCFCLVGETLLLFIYVTQNLLSLLFLSSFVWCQFASIYWLAVRLVFLITCVFVCVRETEREREKEKEREIITATKDISLLFLFQLYKQTKRHICILGQWPEIHNSQRLDPPSCSSTFFINVRNWICHL